MNPLVLDEYRNLFRDDSCFDHFVKSVSDRLEQDLLPIILKERVLGAILSPEATKEMLYERMIRRISQSPEILDKLKDRIENDEIVD